jgi:hypothetical protein
VPDYQNGAGQAVLLDGLVDNFIERRRAGEGLCGERSGSQRGAQEELHMNYDSRAYGFAPVTAAVPSGDGPREQRAS